MKQVKIAFTAVAVFAVVGGALAFKANRVGQKVYTHDPADTRPSACTKVFNEKTLELSDQFITKTLASVAPTTINCPLVSIYQGQ